MDDILLRKLYNGTYSKKDVEYARKQIGITRINAQKSCSYVRESLHRKANFLEKKLNEALGKND